jgi:ABC-type transport system involved in multi-copper enzyme maturation permease subunit
MSERAPSFIREDEPIFARIVGLFGLLAVTVGGVALILNASGMVNRLIGPGWGTFALVLGVGCLLFHAFRDTDLQFRRLYGFLGCVCFVAGVVVSVIGTRTVPMGTWFLPWGLAGLGLGGLFLVLFARNETAELLKLWTVRALGIAGAWMFLNGFIGGNVSAEFLIPRGLCLLLLGLAYLCAFVALTGTAHDLGYRAGLGIGGLGVLIFVMALIRSLFPIWNPQPYFIPYGLVLMGVALPYGLMAFGLCSDNKIVVLTRRELAAIFFSPIAYFVLFGFTLFAWWSYTDFLALLVEASGPGSEPLTEPIVRFYAISWVATVISIVFIVPVLTMRLLSEEHRSGTLEVLLTAPLDEASVVISKFLGVFLFYLILWIPWSLFLVALYFQGGESFDYRPLLSLAFAVMGTGAGFLSMGLFFSSLTRNQIISFVLTLVCMFMLTFVWFLARKLGGDSPWRTIINYISYVQLWIESVQGTLSPRYLVFHISAAIFWLFLTVKVLEARKWT